MLNKNSCYADANYIDFEEDDDTQLKYAQSTMRTKVKDTGLKWVDLGKLHLNYI